MTSPKTLFAGLGALVLLTGAAIAQTNDAPTATPAKEGTTASAKPSKYDKKFMTTVAQGSMAEVKLGKLALEKATSPDVKQVAQTIVDDHTKANASLMEVAQSERVALPKEIDRTHQEAYAHLEKLSGAAFDKAYIAGQVKDHHMTVALFKKHEATKNGPLKDFITEYLPKIEEHTKMLDDVQAGKAPAMSGMGQTGSNATGTM
jgi:putative membrane protein